MAKKGTSQPKKRRADRPYPDNETISVAIKALGRSEGIKSKVVVYRVVGEYTSCQKGHDGLEFVGEIEGKAWTKPSEWVSRI